MMQSSNLVHNQVDEDEVMKSQMEKMVSSYDSYMRRMTFGREHALREMTVRLAQVQPGDSVLEVGCGTGSLTLEAKRVLDHIIFNRSGYYSFLEAGRL